MATPLLLKQAFVKAGLGTFAEADRVFKHPAVPQLRDVYKNLGQVISRIDSMDLNPIQKDDLKDSVNDLVSRGFVTL
jgi:hypothetical protein